MLALKCFCEEPMTLEPNSEEWCATSCGHMFHYLCLMQWIERSETCPQCRKSVGNGKMFRLYPTTCEDKPKDDGKEVLEECLQATQKQLEDTISLCRKKDVVIEDLKVHADNDKNFKLENEALKSILDTYDTKRLDELFEDTENFDRVLKGKMALLFFKQFDQKSDENSVPNISSEVTAEATNATENTEADDEESEALNYSLNTLSSMMDRITEINDQIKGQS